VIAEDDDEVPSDPELADLFARVRALLEPVDGPEPDPTIAEWLEHVADMDVGEAMDEVIQAMADGELAIEDAAELVRTLAAKLEGRRR
jgi:hypothetical protein